MVSNTHHTFGRHFIGFEPDWRCLIGRRWEIIFTIETTSWRSLEAIRLVVDHRNPALDGAVWELVAVASVVVSSLDSNNIASQVAPAETGSTWRNNAAKRYMGSPSADDEADTIDSPWAPCRSM